MYCPQCATANSPDVKFCRTCGTPLEAVALALNSKPQLKQVAREKPEKTAQDWLETRIKGVSSLTRGSILLAVSLVLGAPLGLFLPSSFDAPWIVIWAVFFGWMAVWGGIDMANGISSILESKSRLRLLGVTGNASVHEPAQHDALSTDKLLGITSTSDSFQPSVASVTEGTTRHLIDDESGRRFE